MLGHDRGDLADHVGHVAVDDDEPVRALLTRHDGLGEVDRVVDLPVLEEAAQGVGGHDGAVALGLLGGGAQVGQGDALGVLVDLRGGEVAHVAAQRALVQGGHDGVGVNDLGAREVEQHRGLLHEGQALGAHQSAGGGDEGHVNGEDVGAAEDLLHGVGPLDLGAQVPGVLHGDTRVEADDVEPQPQGGVGHLHADGPQADDAERAAGQLESDELLLAGLDGLGDLGVVALEGVGEAGRRDEVARGDEQSRQDQLLDGVGVGAGSVEHGHAALGERLDRDVVRAGAGPGHGQDRVLDGGVVELGRTHQQGVGLLHGAADLVELVGQAGQASTGDGVEGADAELVVNAAGGHGSTFCRAVRGKVVAGAGGPVGAQARAAKSVM